jgi:hypothetical protein
MQARSDCSQRYVPGYQDVCIDRPTIYEESQGQRGDGNNASGEPIIKHKQRISGRDDLWSMQGRNPDQGARSAQLHPARGASAVAEGTPSLPPT